jgi:DNA polymerase-3 subunit alpha
VAERLRATPTAELGAKAIGSRVTLLGHVTALKEIPTKNGGRMAFATLEDMSGSVELTVFPAPFNAAASLLRSREPIVVRGRVNETEKGRVMLAEEIRPVEGAGPHESTGAGQPDQPADPFAWPPEPEAQACRIRILAEGDAPGRLTSVKHLLGGYPGKVALFLHLLLPQHEVVVRVRELSVDPAQELVLEVEALLGPGSISVDYARRA